MERRLAAVLVADMAGYSRLMEQDEEGVLNRQKKHRRELIDPEIAAHKGRIVKTTGDGMLAEFGSAQDAVRCAMNIQTAMVEREIISPTDTRITYRFGINLGDVVFEDDDIFGDGVNVASRLQGLSEPGSVCVSDIVHQAISERFREPFRDMGSQRVKNISRPIRVWQWTPGAKAEEKELSEEALRQRVRFAAAPDGVQIAWASIGEGKPVLKGPNWLNHIEYEWRSPVWGPVFAELARHCQLVRFDQRGNGTGFPPEDRCGSCVTSTVMSTTVRNCTRDEGGPFEAGSQVLVSSHRKLLSSKAMVVSVAETPGQDSGRQG